MIKQVKLLLLILLLAGNTYAQKTTITGTINNTSLKSIVCNLIPNRAFDKVQSINILLNEGKFTHQLNVEEPTFLSFAEGSNYFGGVVQPGDSIVIYYDATKPKETLVYNGRGKEKFELANEINGLRTSWKGEKAKGQQFPVDYLFNKIDSVQGVLQQHLMATKTAMSTKSFKFLDAYIKATVLRTKYNGLIDIFGDSYDNILKHQDAKLSPNSRKAMAQLLRFDNNLAYSYFYVSSVANVLSTYYADNIQSQIADNIQSKYSILSKKLSTDLKPPVLFLLLDGDIRQNKGLAIAPIIEQYYALPKDVHYKKVLETKLADARALKNGAVAPNFSLTDLNGKKITLASLKGKVVHLDFWFGACEPCIKLFDEIEPVKKHFKSDSNVVFLIVSIDNAEIWKKALVQNNISGTHVFTENKFKAHPVIAAYNVNQYPTTYLIDKEGRVLSTSPSKNATELKKEIEEALLR